MSLHLVYPLGKAIGSMQLILNTSLKMKKKDDPDAWKVHYAFVMENLIEIFDNLESTGLSNPTLIDVSDELERIVSIYGELKYDQTLPRGQRIIGGIKQKFSLMRQSRKNLKNEDIEILNDKLKLWDDRLVIVLSNE
ncbi:MAG: hypothetical protein GPJ54_14595 [Candidatus Heimdallarchaeota archaeon]|nr:hypothetical protein [Candidatus Heimdallarchaeota archaeon]